MLKDTIAEKMKSNNYLMSTEQLLDIGMSKTTLTNYVRGGVLDRCGHGYYTMPDTIVDDLYLTMVRSRHIVFSHETALFLNGLSERTPAIHVITVPGTASIPAEIREQCKCYYVKKDLYEVGLTRRTTTFGNVVRCYDPERTLCDMIRSRNRTDEETVIAAIRHYSTYKEKNLTNLGRYAALFKIEEPVRRYMEVLL